MGCSSLKSLTCDEELLMFLWQKNRPFTPKKTNKSVLMFVKLRDVCKNLFTTEIIDSFVNFKLPSFEMDKRNVCNFVRSVMAALPIAFTFKICGLCMQMKTT